MPLNVLSRRRFLDSLAILAGSAALPAWFEAEAHDSSKSRVPLAANDRPASALIGCGGMGRNDATNASRFDKVVALRDVDENRLAEAQVQFPTATRHPDFRDCVEHPRLHVAINGTPNHWHTLINLAAIWAGKDLDSEKPLTRRSTK